MTAALEFAFGALGLHRIAADADPRNERSLRLLEGLGFSGITDVRVGRLIELDVADGTSDADLEAMCRQLLANLVIENYRIEKLETA